MAAKRLDARNGEGHVPEIGFRAGEFNTDIGFAVAGAPDGDYVTFKPLRSVIVHQEQLLADDNRLFERKKRSMAVHGLRMRLNAELFAFRVFSVDRERYSNRYPKRATPFFDAKVEQRHWDQDLVL